MAACFLQFSTSVWIAFEIFAKLRKQQIVLQLMVAETANCAATHTLRMSIPFTLIFRSLY